MSLFRNTTFDTSPLVLHGQGPDYVHPFWDEVVSACFAEPRRRLGASPDVTVLTWNNGGRDDLGLLERSLEHLGVPCRVLGGGVVDWVSSRDKPHLTAEALAEVDTPFVLGVDSRDAVVVGDPAELPKRLPDGCEILFNSERVNFPCIAEFQAYEDSLPGAAESPYRYLNGGAWLGRTEFCRQFFAEARNTPPLAEHPESEQGILKRLLRRHHPRVRIDTTCRVFQTLGFVFAKDFELAPAERYHLPFAIGGEPKAWPDETQEALLETARQALPDLVSITPLHGSGRCFIVTDADGRKLKLRVCAGEAQASALARRARRLRGVMPAPVRLQGPFLLFPFVDGREVNGRQKPKVLHQLGRLQALAHRHVCHGRGEELDRFVVDLLGRLSAAEVFDPSSSRRLREFYDLRRGQHEFAFAFDLRDSSDRNFLVDGERVVYVDEGGVGKLLGVGLARLVKRCARRSEAARFILGRDLESFRAGYESVRGPFPEPGYLQLVGLFDLIQRMYRHHAAGTSLRADLADLERLVDGGSVFAG